VRQTVTRRHMVGSGVAAGTALGLGDLSFLRCLRPVSASESKLPSDQVRLDAGIEPVVRLLEDTPRERLLEEVADRIRKGLSYRDLVAGLLLAGVTNVEPRPSVGHKFHTVLVVNSAHLASMSSPAEHRWLPIFWALDYYKSAAARDVRERGDWKMKSVAEGVPPAHKARDSFVKAMDNWDEAAADRAVAGLARSGGVNDIYEMCFRYGARDFRSIGHKAIFVANSYRTLASIGRQHAEPVLRSLAYALLMHEGDNPARRDDEADRPFRRNRELVKKIRSQWLDGKTDSNATQSLLTTLRSGSNDEACDHVVELLNGGVGVVSIWDGLHVAAGEMVMQQPGIIALHAVTTTNALYFAFQTSADDETRRLLMLQNAAFLPMFRWRMPGRGHVDERTIGDLRPGSVGDDSRATIGKIFAGLRGDPLDSAQTALGFLKDGDARAARAKELIKAARLLVFLKGDNAHDYKFSSAILEDYHHVSPAWRDFYMATNLFLLKGSTGPDNELVKRTRAALARS